MADDTASDPTSPGGDDPLSDLEDEFEGDPLAGGQNPFGGEASFEQEELFGAEDPFAAGAFGDEPPALMMAKLWIRQNALLSVGVAFAAGTLIGVLQK